MGIQVKRQYKETNYSVDTDGNVYSPSGIMKPQKDNIGYIKVTIVEDGKQKRYSVHRMVAITFIPNKHNHPDVNHKNSDKSDNRLSNLEWCSKSYNHIHKYENLSDNKKTGRMSLTMNEVKEIRNNYDGGNIRQYARSLDMSYDKMFNIIKNKTYSV